MKKPWIGCLPPVHSLSTALLIGLSSCCVKSVGSATRSLRSSIQILTRVKGRRERVAVDQLAKNMCELALKLAQKAPHIAIHIRVALSQVFDQTNGVDNR